MKAIIDELKEIFSFEGHEAEITFSTQPQFGHYQCNSAMKLTKVLGKPPRKIAEEIIDKVNANPIFEKLEIAGPGFINIWLSLPYLNEKINYINQDTKLGLAEPVKKHKIIVEFSSPNTAKEMHAGHLRSTIIGDSLARLFEFMGHDVLRLNHIGDWGTSFGMLIAYIKKFHPKVLSDSSTKAELSDLVNWYKKAKKCFDEDEAFKKASQLEVVSLQGGNDESLNIWQTICDISRKAYQEIYDILDIKLQERGESYYNKWLPDLIKDLENKELIVTSDGAKCMFFEGFKNKEGDLLPFMVQKSDGGFNYDTTDLAAIKQRVEEEKADRIIYVVDQGQTTHFQLLFKAAEKARYLDPKKTDAVHVPFGLVLGSDGKKFKTRSGDTVRLIDLLEAAINEAYLILLNRKMDISESEIKELAHNLGINAVKYADLSCQRTQDYTFSFDRMLRFEGNTAAFLMYSYVRIFGIKRKIGKNIAQVTGLIHMAHPSEIALGLHLVRFQEILNNIAKELYPHRLAEYLYQLAEKFNAFFRDCRVEGSDEESSRLLLADLTAKTLKMGMHILGLKTVERM